MQYLPQIPPAISPSSPPLPSSSRGAVLSARAHSSKPALFSSFQVLCCLPSVHLHLPVSLTASSADPTDRPGLQVSTSLPPFSCANGGLDGFAQTDRQLTASLDPPRDTSLSLPQDDRQDDLSPPTSAARLRCVFANSPAPRRQVKKKHLGPQGRSIATWTASPPWVRVPPKRAPPRPILSARAHPPAAISTDLSNRIRILAHIHFRTPCLNSTERPPSSVPGVSCLPPWPHGYLPFISDPRNPCCLGCPFSHMGVVRPSLSPASALASDRPNLHICAEPPQKR
ncbi:hypothetical protein B0T18DRAFT_400351 [Schizothecium vesticola]|uniref:Uncharacterized protein n=1 Tax=Schizothecium vesticola TaxID=314040 RepID=A0AA40FBW7_9PEZI|nr:hypothetical protein B0T18DRAFT_400351 [Schizothecium vesticola]